MQESKTHTWLSAFAIAAMAGATMQSGAASAQDMRVTINGGQTKGAFNRVASGWAAYITKNVSGINASGWPIRRPDCFFFDAFSFCFSCMLTDGISALPTSLTSTDTLPGSFLGGARRNTWLHSSTDAT